MAEFVDVVRRRRMTRAFSGEPIAPETVDRIVELASRSPSAGKSQGWSVIVLEGPDTSRFWDCTLPPERRERFAWPGLLRAPVVLVIVADPQAYVERYSEPDKAATGLGAGVEAWPTPYWTVDAGMATMTMLLAAEDLELGCLFFAVFHGEAELRSALDIPAQVDIVGAIALGHRAAAPPGRSASRPRRSADELVHRGSYRRPSGPRIGDSAASNG